MPTCLLAVSVGAAIFPRWRCNIWVSQAQIIPSMVILTAPPVLPWPVLQSGLSGSPAIQILPTLPSTLYWAPTRVSGAAGLLCLINSRRFSCTYDNISGLIFKACNEVLFFQTFWQSRAMYVSTCCDFCIIIIKDLQKVAKKCTGKFYARFPASPALTSFNCSMIPL